MAAAREKLPDPVQLRETVDRWRAEGELPADSLPNNVDPLGWLVGGECESVVSAGYKFAGVGTCTVCFPHPAHFKIGSTCPCSGAGLHLNCADRDGDDYAPGAERPSACRSAVAGRALEAVEGNVRANCGARVRTGDPAVACPVVWLSHRWHFCGIDTETSTTIIIVQQRDQRYQTPN